MTCLHFPFDVPVKGIFTAPSFFCCQLFSISDLSERPQVPLPRSRIFYSISDTFWSEQIYSAGFPLMELITSPSHWCFWLMTSISGRKVWARRDERAGDQTPMMAVSNIRWNTYETQQKHHNSSRRYAPFTIGRREQRASRRRRQQRRDVSSRREQEDEEKRCRERLLCGRGVDLFVWIVGLFHKSCNGGVSQAWWPTWTSEPPSVIWSNHMTSFSQ